MIRKNTISLLAMSAVSALALGATAAAPSSALPAVAARSCPAVGNSSSGADHISVTFHNQSVTVTARVNDSGPGATALYVTTFAGTKDLAVASSSPVDQRSRTVSFTVPAKVKGGADSVGYFVRTTIGATSETAYCYR
ncbi:hypothetical protein OG885_02290 [Streptomyces sp. NBC_00028]|uniref:hypothetical protein n=1 Tax=Streptomyces sp. NBC_00028 TaxID=2975624 RepID=UPI00324539D9